MTNPLLSGRVFRVGLALVVLLAVGNLLLWAWAARRAPPVAATTAPARIPASAAGGWAIEDYDIVEEPVAQTLVFRVDHDGRSREDGGWGGGGRR